VIVVVEEVWEVREVVEVEEGEVWHLRQSQEFPLLTPSLPRWRRTRRAPRIQSRRSSRGEEAAAVAEARERVQRRPRAAKGKEHILITKNRVYGPKPMSIDGDQGRVSQEVIEELDGQPASRKEETPMAAGRPDLIMCERTISAPRKIVNI
jgi:hypothetical protein